MTLDGELLQRLEQWVDTAAAQVIADRHDFHKYAEAGWTEFRTASLIARRLTELGFAVAAGREVIDAESRMGVPGAEALAAHWERARAQGGDPKFLQAVRGGFTGVVGVLRGGDGPTIGLRFDIDALELQESRDPRHRPMAEGFASINNGVCHACGHDAHAAMGLGVARVLSGLRHALRGTVKLIFQPAEEGVRGAKSMVAAGVVDDVDEMLAVHVYSGWKTGQVATAKGGFLATDKFDVIFTGKPAHAGGAPHEGKNALLAAATAVLNLYAIPRHRDGATRINVGRLVAGQGRNVVPPSAQLVMETRGATSELNAYMYDAAMRVAEAAAAMYDCTLDVQAMGGAQSADSDPQLAHRVAEIVRNLDGLTVRLADPGGGGSEDYTYMMQRVQSLGGRATSMGLGADAGGWGHHTAEFDIDDQALPLGVKFLVAAVLDLTQHPIEDA